MKQTRLEEHIIKSRIKPLTENLQDPTISTGKPQQQIQKLENQPDSKTGVNRVVFGVKVDCGLLAEFREAVQRNGHSYCYLLEGWMRAYVEGTQLALTLLQNQTVNQSFTIVQNLHFDRYVYRPRRVYRRRDEREGFVRVQEHGSAGECGVCGSGRVVGCETFWKDRGFCLKTWVCRSCHEFNRKRGFVHGFSKVEVCQEQSYV